MRTDGPHCGFYGDWTYIHEQNAFPGLTNKLLSRKVNRVFIAFEDAAGYFKTKDRPVVVGNPVRKSFAETSREEARRLLGIDPEDFVVLSFGGNLGAKKINDEMKIAAEELKDRKGLRIFLSQASVITMRSWRMLIPRKAGSLI